MTSELPAAICLAIACAGCAYLIYAAATTAAFASKSASRPAATPATTILKPLKGDEPGLYENLASFCAQDYPAPVQILFGVQDRDDPAAAVVARLRASFPAMDIALVADPAVHGTNLKISNIINMMAKARHACLVLADSDIAVPPDYLMRLAAALARPGVGGVTCLYRGVAAAGVWSRLSALAIDAHFLPNTLVGMRLGLATPCFGSTIAFHRERLDAIGGFAAFANVLADDYAIGAALRAKGWTVSVPPFLVGHTCTDASLVELWRHELRWARTIRSIDPIGHTGSAATHPLAFALAACAAGAPSWGLGAAMLAILCRIVLLLAASRKGSGATAPFWLVPLRDCLSFAIFVWSFCGRSLTWRGRAYHVQADGHLTADLKDRLP